MPISELPEENASVNSILGFGDVEEYTRCFLTLEKGCSSEMGSHASSVRTKLIGAELALSFEKPGDDTLSYLSKWSENELVTCRRALRQTLWRS